LFIVSISGSGCREDQEGQAQKYEQRIHSLQLRIQDGVGQGDPDPSQMADTPHPANTAAGSTALPPIEDPGDSLGALPPTAGSMPTLKRPATSQNVVPSPDSCDRRGSGTIERKVPQFLNSPGSVQLDPPGRQPSTSPSHTCHTITAAVAAQGHRRADSAAVPGRGAWGETLSTADRQAGGVEDGMREGSGGSVGHSCSGLAGGGRPASAPRPPTLGGKAQSGLTQGSRPASAGEFKCH
jgi:hypothetical protein